MSSRAARPRGTSPVPALAPATFREPPAKYRGWAMWELDLSRMTTPEAVAAGVRKLADHGYGGFFMVVSHASGARLDPEYVRQGRPFFGFTDGGVEYLSEEFFRLYRAGLEEAKRQGLNVIFYDDYYFFANSSDRHVDTEVVLRGGHALEAWNPHTGGIEPAQATHGEQGGADVTILRLVLPPVSSLFYVEQDHLLRGRAASK